MVQGTGASSQLQWTFVTTTSTSLELTTSTSSSSSSSSSSSHRVPRLTAAQRTLIQQHVMRDIGYSRRKSVRWPARVHLPSSAAVAAFTPIPKSIGSLPTGPVAVEYDAQQLVDHMFSHSLPSCLRLYRDKWYPLCVKDAAAFHQMLANYATLLSNWQQGSRGHLKRLVLSCHTEALGSIRHRLDSLDDSAYEGVLTAIAALACHAHLGKNVPTWKMHIAAASQIIGSKARLLAKSNPNLLSLLQWVDVIGSFAFDLPPSLNRFALGPEPSRPPAQLDNRLPELPPTFYVNLSVPSRHALQTLRYLNSAVVQLYVEQGPSLWEKPSTVDSLVYPVVSLMLSSQLNGPQTEFIISSCCRTAAILYLAELRRRSGISPVVTDVHVQNLRSLFDSIEEPLNMDAILRLWVLTIGAVESRRECDQLYFYNKLIILQLELQFDTLAELTELLGKVAWFDAIFEDQMERVFRNL